MYNTRWVVGLSKSEHDWLIVQDMTDVLELPSTLLDAEEQESVFCYVLQPEKSYEMLVEEVGDVLEDVVEVDEVWRQRTTVLKDKGNHNTVCKVWRSINVTYE